MTSAIVFSRDRAAQLDLLLTSLTYNAPDLFKRVTVLFTHSTQSYRKGYQACMDEHPGVLFIKERDFRDQVRSAVDRADRSVAFLCDDDVAWRWQAEAMLPDPFLAANKDVLCVSLRLGGNTTECYPLRRNQRRPKFVERRGMRAFKWADADGDFGYPGSLDGHVFRKDQLRYLISDGAWTGPNSLEDHLNTECRRSTMVPFMGCYQQSLILGCPVNRVQETHRNRAGELHAVSALGLNNGFLAGTRLRVQDLVFPDVRAAHVEVALEAKEAV